MALALCDGSGGLKTLKALRAMAVRSRGAGKVLRYRIMTPRDNIDRNHNCGSAHLGLQQKWYKVRKFEEPPYGGAFSYVSPAFKCI